MMVFEEMPFPLLPQREVGAGRFNRHLLCFLSNVGFKRYGLAIGLREALPELPANASQKRTKSGINMMLILRRQSDISR